MLKVKFKKQKIKIEMNWPTKAKQSKKIGPFFGKVKTNAIQVTRKACLLIITLGKTERGKWNQLTKKSLEHQKLEEGKENGVPGSASKNMRKDISRDITMTDSKISDFEDSRSLIFKSQNFSKKSIRKTSLDKKYSHLPFFNGVRRNISRSIKSKKHSVKVDRTSAEDDDKSVTCDAISVGASCVSKEIRFSHHVLEEKRGGSYAKKGRRIRSKSSNLMARFNFKRSSKSANKKSRHSSMAIKKHIQRVRSSRKVLKGLQNRRLSLRKSSNKSPLKRKSVKVVATAEKIRKPLTPIKNLRNVKSRVRSFRTVSPNQKSRPRTAKKGKKSLRKDKQVSRKLSPNTESSIKKFKKQIPLLKNELKMLLIKDKFPTEDYNSKENYSSRGICSLKNLKKIVKNKKILKDIKNYESSKKKQKMKILHKLVKALKNKLIEEQSLRMTREKELQEVLYSDNSKVSHLVTSPLLTLTPRKSN